MLAQQFAAVETLLNSGRLRTGAIRIYNEVEIQHKRPFEFLEVGLITLSISCVCDGADAGVLSNDLPENRARYVEILRVAEIDVLMDCRKHVAVRGSHEAFNIEAARGSNRY